MSDDREQDDESAEGAEAEPLDWVILARLEAGQRVRLDRDQRALYFPHLAALGWTPWAIAWATHTAGRTVRMVLARQARTEAPGGSARAA